MATPAMAMVGPTTEAAPVAASMVMVLQHQGSSAGFCTGVVLAPDVVLTAAHCVPKGADLRVSLPGDPTKPVLLPLVGVARHPDYRPDAIKERQRSVDLALLHLAHPLPDRFVAAALARTAGTKVGARFIASGYGVAREDDAASSGTLRSATLSARGPLSSLLLWADDPQGHAGACTGNSGGPVVADNGAEVTALILWSAGDGARQCGSLTQAIWLAPQRAWIDRVMQAWRQ